ncbi:hypothetical protein BT67DRAFT_487323 [Trichocladium antarcticum]|uniref:S-adenosyl-L-methionine-dependent methyltransferase n=1 Tax=Trichocladium antarcticum TaxID=1450529 RepID=A0AAN6UE78_9PEZI|nr:hypothetical protein BT67DRAFT_487323 [Trichocladium antarcticum]
MASRLRTLPRAQLARQSSCPHSPRPTRSFTLSSALHAAPRPANQAIRIQSKRPPQPPTQTPKSSPPPPPPPRPSRNPSISEQNATAQPLDVLYQRVKWPLLGAGFLALGMGFYISSVVTSSLINDPAPSPSPSPPSSNSPTPTPAPTPTTPCCPTAPSALAFDSGLDLPESLMGITALRKALAARARGHVLEVAIGTGRNLAYYDWTEVVSPPGQDEDEDEDADAAAAAEKTRARMARLLDRHRTEGRTVRDQQQQQRQLDGAGLEVGALEGEVLSFTGVDLSGEMVGIARDRVRGSVPGLARVMRRRRAEAMPGLAEAEAAAADGGVVVVDALAGRVRLVLGDAVRGLPPPPPTAGADKYDTVVQTFGLCSVEDPGRLLANMAAKVRPDSGRIILLEHGRGWYEWINGMLDEYAPKHFQKYGCWWNRDIEHLVREAAQTVPGLEVVKLERPLWLQAGTTLLIELRVNSQHGAREGTEVGAQQA